MAVLQLLDFASMLLDKLAFSRPCARLRFFKLRDETKLVIEKVFEPSSKRSSVVSLRRASLVSLSDLVDDASHAIRQLVVAKVGFHEASAAFGQLAFRCFELFAQVRNDALICVLRERSIDGR